MDQPTDDQIARLRAQGDQMRAYVRDVVLGLKPPVLEEFIKVCALGDFKSMAPNDGKIAGWLAVVAILDILEDRDRAAAAVVLPEDELIRVLIGTVCAFPDGATAEQITRKLLAEGKEVTLEGIAARLARLVREGHINEDRPGIYEGA